MRNDNSKITGCVSNAVCALAIMEAVLVLSSWIISTAFPEVGIRSLICSEGIRWFFGGFTANIGDRTTACLLLSAMAYGCVARSKMCGAVKKLADYVPLLFRERLAFMLMAVEILMAIIVMLLLTCVPQAILVSVTGDLFPSSFSKSIVPVVCFTVVICSITYGLVTDNLKTVNDIVWCLIYGCQKAAPVFVLYVFACQLVCSACYVFAT